PGRGLENRVVEPAHDEERGRAHLDRRAAHRLVVARRGAAAHRDGGGERDDHCDEAGEDVVHDPREPPEPESRVAAAAKGRRRDDARPAVRAAWLGRGDGRAAAWTVHRPSNAFPLSPSVSWPPLSRSATG